MRQFIKSCSYAFSGLLYFFRYERNGRIQLVIAVVGILMGFVLHISLQEWMWLMACIAAVLSFEMMNSAIEKICNLVQPELDPAIKVIKDISAAAVLVIACCCALIAAIIFLPKIIALL